MKNIILFVFFISASLFLLSPSVFGSDNYSKSFSAAFYYAANPPFEELKAFDVVVIDPDSEGVPKIIANDSRSEFFAYISLGEAEPERKNFKRFDQSWFIAENKAWNSRVVDISNPAWRKFFLDEVVEPLWKAGYRGFFLDTLDSYQLGAKKEDLPRMEEALAETIREIKNRHPEVRLILNRGFEVLDRVKDVTFAIAAESLYQNFDPNTGKYGEVKENDRQWLLSKFAEVRKAGLPVIAIDYVPPSNRVLARKTAEKIRKDGFIPWVTDKDISSLGVGSVEVLPRKILGLYDGSEATDPVETKLQRFAVMPLNYLGYQVELHDINNSLPQGVLAGRYAGVVAWLNSDKSGNKSGLLKWVLKHKSDGLPLVFLDRFGLSPQLFAKEMGGRFQSAFVQSKKVKILKHGDEVGFEIKAMPGRERIIPVIFDRSQPWLSLGGDKGVSGEAVAITPWGGYALEPFVIDGTVNEKPRWVIDPFAFFTKALRLEILPAPDTTTENGVRLLLSHIDADGFESRVERPDAPYAAAELREKILKKYRIPTTYSVITSTLGDRGHNKKEAPALQTEAREIFKLPWIEAGSHTFSHPFYWQNTETAKQGYDAQYLEIPGYNYNVDAEISGSAAFIDKNLLPPGKKTLLIQWSGDCAPDLDALAASYSASLRNINGGDTLITETNKTITAVAPLGIFKGGWFQIFAPNQNENIYTNGWTGPFYGYRRVIETFRLTDSPRRLKPINIYYHTFSVTKEASRRALEDVYDWALAQKPNPIFTSEYVDKVLDFNSTVIARSGDGWLIRNAGCLKEFRIPKSAGYPDLTKSRRIAGFSDFNDQRYIHLAPGGEAYLKLTEKPPILPYLYTGQSTLKSFERTDKGLRLRLKAEIPGELAFGAAEKCRIEGIKGGGKPRHFNDRLTVQIQAGEHALELICR